MFFLKYLIKKCNNIKIIIVVGVKLSGKKCIFDNDF